VEGNVMQKNYDVKDLDKYTYINFYGDIDDSVCPIYKEEISEIIKKNKTKDLVFDFKNVTFIDSSGLGFILGRYNQIKTNRKRLYVANTNDQIKKLFRISGIYTIIKEFEFEKVGAINE
jgi:stage II sporulation protein AA (anti-sigma F factor antagonist)